MTLNLKLVRHQDGKWTALTPESDDIAPVSVTERKSAPIDPAQLLKALDSLLSPEGGIRCIDDVPRLASLMKKFSKKLVSRCVYCNVLQATKPEVISEYLDKGGWETINTWLQYAKSSNADSFLLEMLKLCKQLPMTLNRLKENNTAKLIKSLSKHENKDVKELSNELVNLWMSIIKDKKTAEASAERKKKKEKSSRGEKVESTKEESKVSIKSSTGSKSTAASKSAEESPKAPGKLKSLKRPPTDKEKNADIYEDVKIDPEPLMPVSKKPRADRPKTAKIYQKKFRATGLEEANPLPKNISKKTSNVDKTAAVAAAKSTLKLNTSPLERITEKKIKPESLMAINENANSKGIKLIPAKPRPTYTLQESASFMDALVSQPVVPVKRKKKVSPKMQSPQQTSPTISPPKFQFYKDTLEEKMSEENKQEPENIDTSENNESEKKSENSPNSDENVPMEVTEEGGYTPPNSEANENDDPNDDTQSKNESDQTLPCDPKQLRSILSYGKRRGKKKTVKWVDDSEIKEVFYFEKDETERVNVSRNSNFYDLKSIEMKREREAMELAKRQANDRVEEFRKWWIVPILVDVPPPLVEPGCQSQEKHIELMRQQSTLQEIYFTREMIPDSPHEPDLEIVAAQEPKVIPLDEENLISTLNDYSNYKAVATSLPDILTSLMKLQTNNALKNLVQNVEPMPVAMDIEPIEAVQPPILNMDALNQQKIPMPMPINLPVSEPQHVNVNGMIGQIRPSFSPPHVHNHGPIPGPAPMARPDFPGEWQGPPADMSPNEYYGGYQMNPNTPLNPPHPGMNMRGSGTNNFRPNFRGGPRGMGSRLRKVCRHFTAGHCRYGFNCTFLHPGVNGPPL